MIIDNCNAWQVRVTFPPGSKDPHGKERRWAHNDTITVVAVDIDRASAAVRRQWPNVTIWSVNHVGSRTILMVDDTAKEVPAPTTGTCITGWPLPSEGSGESK